MVDISESTAHMESDSGDKHCIAFSEVKTDENDTQWIRIPDLFAPLDYLGIPEDDVEMYHNEDGFVSFGSSTGQGIAEIPVEEHDGEYWLQVTEEMETISPLDNANQFPVFFLSCGEFWILNNNDLWDKLAAEFER